MPPCMWFKLYIFISTDFFRRLVLCLFLHVCMYVYVCAVQTAVLTTGLSLHIILSNKN